MILLQICPEWWIMVASFPGFPAFSAATQKAGKPGDEAGILLLQNSPEVGSLAGSASMALRLGCTETSV